MQHRTSKGPGPANHPDGGGAWGRGGGQGGDVVMEFLSVAPTPRRHPRTRVQEASPRNQIETSRLLRLLYVHESHTRANPNRHSSESQDENWVSNHRLGQFRISAPVTRSNPKPDSYSRCGPAASQASLRAITAHLKGSLLRDRKGTHTGDLDSNNLKDKRRTINT
jgi:hypothetical protein